MILIRIHCRIRFFQEQLDGKDVPVFLKRDLQMHCHH